MGAALKRPFKMYNIEARAHKLLEKSKTVPRPSPRYPTEVRLLQDNNSGRSNELIIIPHTESRGFTV